jgi:hypothetical protein
MPVKNYIFLAMFLVTARGYRTVAMLLNRTHFNSIFALETPYYIHRTRELGDSISVTRLLKGVLVNITT